MAQSHKFDSPAQAREFLLAGKARFTVVSERTGTRYTFRISGCDDRPGLFFVSLLAGPDNEADYVYLGVVRDGSALGLTAKSKMTPESGPVKAFNWTWNALRRDTMPAQAEVWHEGACGRCGRLLTVPESIESGFGPECQKHLGLAGAATIVSADALGL